MTEDNLYDNSSILKESENSLKNDIQQIQRFCFSKSIPFYMQFAIANDEKKTTYKIYKSFPSEALVVLTNDRFRLMILSGLGFQLVSYNDFSFSKAQKYTDESEYSCRQPFIKECLTALKHIRKVCQESKIPYYVLFAVVNNKDGTDYIQSNLLPDELGLSLAEDKFTAILESEKCTDIAINHQDTFEF